MLWGSTKGKLQLSAVRARKAFRARSPPTVASRHRGHHNHDESPAITAVIVLAVTSAPTQPPRQSRPPQVSQFHRHRAYILFHESLAITPTAHVHRRAHPPNCGHAKSNKRKSKRMLA